MGGDLDSAAINLTEISGTYTLAATGAMELALAPRTERNTSFTGELLHLLNTGDDRLRELISLDDISVSDHAGAGNGLMLEMPPVDQLREQLYGGGPETVAFT